MIADVSVSVSCDPKATEHTWNKALEALADAIMDLEIVGIEIICTSASRPYKPEWEDEEDEDPIVAMFGEPIENAPPWFGKVFEEME